MQLAEFSRGISTFGAIFPSENHSKYLVCRVLMWQMELESLFIGTTSDMCSLSQDTVKVSVYEYYCMNKSKFDTITA